MDCRGETLGALLGQGRTAEVFEWGGACVVKLFRTGYEAHAEREAEVARVAQVLGRCTPALQGQIQVGKRVGLVFERVLGHSLMSLLSSKPWLLRRGARVLARLHVAIHGCAAPELAALRDQLRMLIERAEGLTKHQRAMALEVLEQMPDGERLCHGDMHPGNVMQGAAGPVVIDWGTAARGDPLVDVGVTAMILRLGELPPGSPWLLRRLVPVMRERLGLDYLRAYGLTKADRQRLEGWQLPLAAARLGRAVDGERRALLAMINAAVPPSHPVAEGQL